MQKQTFNFYLDRKVTIWVREQHSIEAESEEEAKKEMIEAFKDNFCSESFDEQEWLLDTETMLEPGDNGGESTAELFFEDTDELLTTNIDLVNSN
jgi:hypothetical protein